MLTKPVRLVDEEVLDRARTAACLVCFKASPSDPSHIKTRGSGGPDTDWNVVPMCRVHHTEWHKVGSVTFVRRHPGFGARIYKLGWFITGEKLWNDKLNASSKGTT